MSEAGWDEFDGLWESPRDSRGHRLVATIESVFAKCEAVVGVTAAFFVGFGVVLVLAIATLMHLSDGDRPTGLGLAALCIVGSGLATWVVAMASAAVRRCYPEWADDPVKQIDYRPDELAAHEPWPFAVELGLSVPTTPWLVRLMLSVWWLGHFAAGLLAALGVHSWVEASFVHILPRVVAPILLHLGLTISANLYLILAGASLLRDPEFLTRLWGSRFLIDMAISLPVVLCYLRGVL